MLNFFKKGLEKTKKAIQGVYDRINIFGSKPDENLLNELEESLIVADLGVDSAAMIVNHIRKSNQKEWNINITKSLIKEKILEILTPDVKKLKLLDGLNVVLVVGVNGVGKTTTIAKLAQYFKTIHKKVMLAAGDTFRAGAIDQLSIWADRLKISIVKHESGADPSAVAFDAVELALRNNIDVLILDTAGRLHTQRHLMEELKKVHRTLSKKLPGAPHHTLLVVDGSTGQNALVQAKQFNEAVPLTGFIVTKLDGTAKGGMVLQIQHTLKIPVYFVGVGEAMDDLQPFDANEFVDALLDIA